MHVPLVLGENPFLLRFISTTVDVADERRSGYGCGVGGGVDGVVVEIVKMVIEGGVGISQGVGGRVDGSIDWGVSRGVGVLLVGGASSIASISISCHSITRDIHVGMVV